jgi:hypothetical protein
MKKIADQMAAGGVEPRVEHYCFIFLRFCATGARARCALHEVTSAVQRVAC